MENESSASAPYTLIQKYCNELNLSQDVISKAQEVCDKSLEHKLGNIKPHIFAASAIYIASILCNERRTQANIAEVAQIGTTTIRNTYKKIIETVGVLVQL